MFLDPTDLRICLDGRAAHLLPEILPESVQGLPVVYWDGEEVYCPSCANIEEIRPFILALDIPDVDDCCAECGSSFENSSFCGGVK